ncbi:hypothetical protein BROUX41_002991 [Berkeleyomyces rouxiae]|uniref:uncharacterized protein n=1 Tax=Berkeleyomyces rouxiae TaxID=2035830 RepID=UPI003B7A7699
MRVVSRFNSTAPASFPTTPLNSTTRALFSTKSPTDDSIHPDPRPELIGYLREISGHALGGVTLTRLQLAINGLQQAAGDEAIRIAVLGQGSGTSAQTAKTLIRALFADPLVDAQPWEAELESHDPDQPLVVRINKSPEGEKGSLISQAGDLKELHISAPTWDKHNIELLFIKDSRLAGPRSIEVSKEGLLDIPVTIGGQTFVTPVHKSLAIADGMAGVSTVAAIPPLQESSSTLAAVNIPGYSPSPEEKLSFVTMDVSSGVQGITLFRTSSRNGMQFEKLWSQSNVGKIRDWILKGAMLSSPETKPVVRSLVSSIVEKADSAIQAAENDTNSTTTPRSDSKTMHLSRALSEWSQTAHAELQDELDKAFSGRRWRQMKWWKLFWRVDDVGLLTSGILHSQFLPRADRSMIFLAGRISEGQPGRTVTYSQPMVLVLHNSDPASQPSTVQASLAADTTALVPKWPTHIAFTRRYLQEETVPALQALSQKLVLQTVSSTGLSASLGALIYASQFSIYEAGSVVALGTVLGLGHMQRKWDKARRFWEDDVREEGRKAVRAAEKSMADVLEGNTDAVRASEDYSLLKAMVSKAKSALASLK